MNDMILIYILLMAAITYLTRFPMLLLSSRMNISPWLQRSLKMVPIGVFSSMTVPQILFHFRGGSWNPEYLVAGIFAFVIGLWTKQIYISLFVGVITVILFRRVFLGL